MKDLVVRRKASNIKKYLQAEFKDKKGRPMKKPMVDSYKFSYPTAPYQSNDCDCGVFALMYAFAACHQMEYTSFKKIHAKPFRKHIFASVMAGKVLDILRYPTINLN
jgi:Ulp1 family protease